jgi:hypothetical protein
MMTRRIRNKKRIINYWVKERITTIKLFSKFLKEEN